MLRKILLAEIHVWPAFLNFAFIKPSIAKSILASEKTIKGALPPSSKEIFFIVFELFFINSFPTFVEPVKVIFFTVGLFDNISPITFGFPLTMLKIPLGNFASTESSPNAKAVIGVNSDGFKTTQHPAASAALTFLVTIARGKFQGVIAATTPTGSFI